MDHKDATRRLEGLPTTGTPAADTDARYYFDEMRRLEKENARLRGANAGLVADKNAEKTIQRSFAGGQLNELAHLRAVNAALVAALAGLIAEIDGPDGDKVGASYDMQVARAALAKAKEAKP